MDGMIYKAYIDNADNQPQQSAPLVYKNDIVDYNL